MKPSRRLRPSAGCLLLVATVLAASSLFGWALTTPSLDQVRRIEVELDLGRAEPLAGWEFSVLQEALLRHEGLAEDLLDDRTWGFISANDDGVVSAATAYLIRVSPDTPGRLEVAPQGSPRVDSVVVEVRTATTQARGEATTTAPFVWTDPQSGPFPELIEVRVTTSGKSGKKRRRAVSVALTEQP